MLLHVTIQSLQARTLHPKIDLPGSTKILESCDLRGSDRRVDCQRVATIGAIDVKHEPVTDVDGEGSAVDRGNVRAGDQSQWRSAFRAHLEPFCVQIIAVVWLARLDASVDGKALLTSLWCDQGRIDVAIAACDQDLEVVALLTKIVGVDEADDITPKDTLDVSGRGRVGAVSRVRIKLNVQ